MKTKFGLVAVLVLAASLVLSLFFLSCCDYASSQNSGELKYKEIDQDTALAMMEEGGSVVVDVRQKEEYDAGHIPGAILIPNETIRWSMPEELPDLNQTVLLYCRSGIRARQAAEKLSAMGYTNLYLFGGITTWKGELVMDDSAEGKRRPENIETIYLAGGCFWGVQKFYDQFDGVVETEVGYANGPYPSATYESVCAGSGHAETVKIDYDADRISLTELLNYYFMIIDPLSVNKQGNDEGVQYRTGIYYDKDDQLLEIEALYREQEQIIGQDLAVELLPLENYTRAEDYHQKYLENHPNGYCHIDSEMYELGEKQREEKLRKRIGDLAFEVTQNAVTERPFSGEYDDFFEKGIYVDVVSGEPLFASIDKFDSGTGWPSFARPIDEDALVANTDFSHGMVRIEVRSSGANSHLGHVFMEGPVGSEGLRYCINSAALEFIPFDEMGARGYGDYLYLFGD